MWLSKLADVSRYYLGALLEAINSYFLVSMLHWFTASATQPNPHLNNYKQQPISIDQFSKPTSANLLTVVAFISRASGREGTPLNSPDEGVSFTPQISPNEFTEGDMMSTSNTSPPDPLTSKILAITTISTASAHMRSPPRCSQFNLPSYHARLGKAQVASLLIRPLLIYQSMQPSW